ncbi:MAG: hypothetical protein J6W42_02835 [Bacteroidaceae bacterium]|nr:hypothetical protein [Bacteroidaceae bacterium]
MEKNAIFNMNRFTALFSTGIYRIKVSQWSIFGGLFIFVSILLLTTLLLQDADKDNVRQVLIGLYQLSYIATLTLATFRHFFNQEKKMIWYMLPASAFEKRLFQTLRILVWNSILFIAGCFLLDHILWSSITHNSIHIDEYYVGLKDIFSFGSPIKGVPAWINYTTSVLFMVLFPFCSSTVTYHRNSMSSGKTSYTIYWVLYSTGMIFHFGFLVNTSTDQVGAIFKIILASISLLYILFDLVFAAVLSCRKDSGKNK